LEHNDLAYVEQRSTHVVPMSVFPLHHVLVYKLLICICCMMQSVRSVHSREFQTPSTDQHFLIFSSISFVAVCNYISA